jgi:hypothetical protein
MYDVPGGGIITAFFTLSLSAALDASFSAKAVTKRSAKHNFEKKKNN